MAANTPQTGFDWYPEEDIINYFYNLFSAHARLITRTIDDKPKTTKFIKDRLVGDLSKDEVKTLAPYLCIKIGQKVEDEADLESSGDSVIITLWAVVDTVIAARTKLIAEKEGNRFTRNMKKVAYDENPEANLIIVKSDSFLMNNDKNNDLHEVHWRTYFKVGYR